MSEQNQLQPIHIITVLDDSLIRNINDLFKKGTNGCKATEAMDFGSIWTRMSRFQR
jgi:hypothetical protein